MERIAPVTFVPRRVVVAGVVLGSLAAAAPASAAVTQIAGSGSSASVPYLEVLFKAYKKVDPSVKFVFTANNGNAGAADVQAGRSQFAIQTRPPLPSDSGLSYSKLFLDALTISVNLANKLSNPLAGQREGTSSRCKVTGVERLLGVGAERADPGLRPQRNRRACTRSSAPPSVGGETQSTNVTPLDKDGEVAVALFKNPNGIGYVGLANSRGGAAGVKRLSLNGVAATPKTIKSLKYPLSRYAWVVLPAKSPNKKVLKFADWKCAAATRPRGSSSSRRPKCAGVQRDQAGQEEQEEVADWKRRRRAMDTAALYRPRQAGQRSAPSPARRAGLRRRAVRRRDGRVRCAARRRGRRSSTTASPGSVRAATARRPPRSRRSSCRPTSSRSRSTPSTPGR